MEGEFMSQSFYFEFECTHSKGDSFATNVLHLSPNTEPSPGDLILNHYRKFLIPVLEAVRRLQSLRRR